MKPCRAEDLFHHRTIVSLDGAPRHDRLVVKINRARRRSDDYERSLWLLQADSDARRITSMEFGASSPKWNGDGSRLAFLSERGDAGLQVHLLTMGGGEAMRLTHARHALSSIEGWSADGNRLLVTASVDWNEDGEPNETPHGARPPQVTRYLPYKKDGPGITVGERTHLFAVDADSGEMSALTEGDYDVSLAGWSPDNRRLMYLRNRSERQRNRTDVWIANADGSEPRMLVDGLTSVSDALWSPDGRWIALLGGEEEGNSMTGLWLADAQTGELRRLGGDDFELEPTAGLQWHPDCDRLLAINSYRGLQTLAVVSVPDGQTQRFDPGMRHVLAATCWGARIAFVAASMRWPEEVYSIDWQGGDEKRHTAFNRSWVRRRPQPHVAKRRFTVPDGEGGEERIDAWILRPAQGQPPHPVLLDMHGGPHSTVLIDYDAHTYWYALNSQGWVIVAPNAVGSGSYGQAFARRLRGRWGELDLPQYEAVIRALQSEGLIDERVVCTGKSYGGFLSAWAVGHSDLFRAAIVCAPVANIESHFGTSDTGYYVTPFAMAGDFHEARERYRALSPITHCHNARAAVLILQGENDSRCPRGQSEELFANLIRCSQAPAELVVYPTSTHSEAESGRPSNRLDYHSRMVRWATRWAQPDAQQDEAAKVAGAKLSDAGRRDRERTGSARDNTKRSDAFAR